jgi:hypothetical protein
MTLYLGKMPASAPTYKLQLKDYRVASGLPTPPLVFGDLAVYDNGPNAIQWGVLGNTQCGDCVFAGMSHQVMLLKAIEGARPYIDPASVIADYSAVTGYKPADPTTDTGATVVDGYTYWRDTGILKGSGISNKIAGFVSCAFDPQSLAEAAYLFGTVGIGLNLPQSALDQFEDTMPWEPVDGSPTAGGHYVPIVGRNTRGYFLCVTWGRLQAMSPDFISKFADEAAVPLSSDWVDATSKVSPRGIKYADLQADLALMGA